MGVKMFECLICNLEFHDKRKFSFHLFHEHNIKRVDYEKKFNIRKKCKKCGTYISENNKSGWCNKCRDRSGANNPFYGKKHSEKTLEKLKPILSAASKKCWQDQEYRNKVIHGMTGKKRSNEFKNTQKENAINQFKDIKQRELRSIHMKKSWEDGLIEPTIHSMNESSMERDLREMVKGLTDLTVEKKTIRIGKKWYNPDIIIDNKIIIEFYGDFWHANPLIYMADDHIHHGDTAGKIWETDKNRFEQLKSGGYIPYHIWETDYKKDISNILTHIETIINNYKNEINKNL